MGLVVEIPRFIFFYFSGARFPFGVSVLAPKIPILYSDKFPLGGVVGDLEPVGALAVAPGGEAAPAYDAWVETALVEEEGFGSRGEVGMEEETFVARGVE